MRPRLGSLAGPATPAWLVLALHVADLLQPERLCGPPCAPACPACPEAPADPPQRATCSSSSADEELEKEVGDETPAPALAHPPWAVPALVAALLGTNSLWAACWLCRQRARPAPPRNPRQPRPSAAWQPTYG